MFKQIYRFLSIILISNLLISPAVLSQPYNNADNANASTTAPHKKSLLEKIFHHKKPAKQKSDNDQNTSIQKPNNNPNFVTKYGVYYPNHGYNAYPQPGDK